MTNTVESTGQQLSGRFDTFNQELIAFVEECSDSDWRKITPVEGWQVGVTGREYSKRSETEFF